MAVEECLEYTTGSLAAEYQRATYGPTGGPPAKSSFAHLQRAGATPMSGPSIKLKATLPYLGDPLSTTVMWAFRISCGIAGVSILLNL
jgi:hypothetical protein